MARAPIPTPPEGASEWMWRVALIGRPPEPVPGLDDWRSLRRILGSALGIYSLGLAAFATIVSRTESLTPAAIAVYLSLGPVLGLGYVVGTRTGRMPGLVLLCVTIWTSLLGTVSEFYFDAAPITTVALCTAFVSWLGSRVAPLYALATVLGLLVSGVVQGAPDLVDRTILVSIATIFAVSIVGRSSDSSRTAHHDREVLLRRLAHESRHDELTGIGNRKQLIEQTMILLGSSSMTTVTLALVDLDGFKAINDTHGHMVGDEVLRTVASRLSDIVDPADTVVRVGGDEFAVLFSALEIDSDAAAELLGSICDEDLVLDGLEIPIRASVGAAARRRESTSLEELLAAADEAMYAQKGHRRRETLDTIVI